VTSQRKNINWEKVREDFIGSGKIQALRIDETPTGFKLIYREGKKQTFIESKTKKELRELLVEFGGKNPETVSAPDQFLKMSGWSNNDLEEMGHTITKIQLTGSHTARDMLIPIEFPAECGFDGILDCKKTSEFKGLKRNIKLKDIGTMDITVVFKQPSQFNDLIDFIKKHETLKKFTWNVKGLVTFSHDTGKYCKWRRSIAGDGTKRMILELQHIDGVHYNNCMFYDLVEAADGMIGGECRKIPDKRNKPKERMICEIFATS